MLDPVASSRMLLIVSVPLAEAVVRMLKMPLFPNINAHLKKLFSLTFPPEQAQQFPIAHYVFVDESYSHKPDKVALL